MIRASPPSLSGTGDAGNEEAINVCEITDAQSLHSFLNVAQMANITSPAYASPATL